MCIDFPLDDKGIIVITKARTPIPPIKCEKLRQNNILLFKFSTLSKIVEPVVVNPETVSNSASIKFASLFK